MIVLDMVLILMKRRIDPIRIDQNLDEPFYSSSKSEILRVLNNTNLLSTLLTIRELNDEIIELLAPYSGIKDLSEKARKAYKDLATLKTWTGSIFLVVLLRETVFFNLVSLFQRRQNSIFSLDQQTSHADQSSVNFFVRRKQRKTSFLQGKSSKSGKFASKSVEKAETSRRRTRTNSNRPRKMSKRF